MLLMSSIAVLCYILITLLNAADVVTTSILLDLGHKERNPLVAWAIRRWGTRLGLLLPKIPVIIVLGFVERILLEFGSWGLLLIPNALIITLYSFIVIRHLRMI